MKSYYFTNADGTFEVEVVTDAIGSAKNFTIMQIKNQGASENRILGLEESVKTEAELVTLATNANLILKSYEHKAGTPAARTVLYNGATPFDITSETLVAGTEDDPYTDTVETEGNIGVISFEVSEGDLPAGLTLNSETGVISGTPTTIEEQTFTISATDGFSTVTKELSIDITA